jgi:hypothetical protein
VAVTELTEPEQALWQAFPPRLSTVATGAARVLTRR